VAEEKLAIVVHLALQVQKEALVMLDLEDHLDSRGPKVPWETRANVEQLDQLENKDDLEEEVPLALKEILVHLECPEQRVHKDPEESKGHLATLEALDSKDLKDQEERGVKLEALVQLENQE